ncbi:hypothetical protein ACH5RR_029681 [Cinchona calisaya]|uniref:Uncharacterized protein n=1 Tax=Cinchona calisaya TaxID=153742 RepID=A0ABD2YW66_9GENT
MEMVEIQLSEVALHPYPSDVKDRNMSFDLKLANHCMHCNTTIGSCKSAFEIPPLVAIPWYALHHNSQKL